MRKDLSRVDINSLYDALATLGYATLGYAKIRQDSSEWRHHQFHLTIRKKPKGKITLQIHEDMRSSLPPFHRARHSSKALEQEFAKILDAYQKRRASKRA